MRIEFESELFGLILNSIKDTKPSDVDFEFHHQLWEVSFSYLSYRALALYDLELLKNTKEWKLSGERAWTAIIRAKTAMDSFASVLAIIDKKKKISKIPSVAEVKCKNQEFQRTLDWISNPHEGANQSYIFSDNWYLRLVHCRNRLIHRGYIVYAISNDGCLVIRSIKPNTDIASQNTMDSFDYIGYDTIVDGLEHRMTVLENQLSQEIRNYTAWSVSTDCRVVFDDSGKDCDATAVCWLPTVKINGLTAAIENFEE